MEITYPISSSRFLLAMQVYARKMAAYETYEDVKKREFERISLFRPLPTVSKESIKTSEVTSSPRYELSVSETEDEVVDLDSLFNNLEELDLTTLQSKEQRVSSDLPTDLFASIDLDALGYEDNMGEDDLEGREFEVEPSEDLSDPFSNLTDSSVQSLEDKSTEYISESENLNLSQMVPSESDLDTEPTRVEFKEEIFRSNYVGKRSPWTYVAKDRGVRVKPKPKVATVSQERVSKVESSKVTQTREPNLSAPKIDKVVHASPLGSQRVVEQTASDKTVRLLNEDFVSYCRRNLRVQEQTALTYFSPNEIESAVRQGKILRKGGLLIFAHS